LHIVLDNFKPHLKAEVLAWASRNNVRLVFTPTNASWLNRIECHFTALKKFALDNSDYTSHEDQFAAIESYLRWHNGQRNRSRGSYPCHAHRNPSTAGSQLLS
jgi:transposase